MPDAMLWRAVNVSDANKEIMWDFQARNVVMSGYYFPNGSNYNTLTISSQATTGVGGHYAHWDDASKSFLADRQRMDIRQYRNSSGTQLI